MRPGQNKRMRGRNNNNGGGNSRKGPNPLTRSYESNGPDVKIRGTAHHIGEKYLQLARDAQSSGDPVMAESYLQHAEHYFRLIAAAQQAQQQAAYGYQRPAGEQSDADDDDGDDDFASLPDRFASPAERVVTPPPQPAPQPYAERPAYNGGDRSYEPRQDRAERYERSNQGQDRQSQERQGQERPNGERPQTQERPYQDRQQAEGRGERYDRGDRSSRGDRQPYTDRAFGNRNQDRSYQDRNQDRAPEAGAQERNGQARDAGQGRDAGQPRDTSSPRDYDNRGQRNGNRGNRDFRDQPRETREPRQPDADPAVNALPAFITTPVRIQSEPPLAGEPIVAEPSNTPYSAAETGSEDGGFALRPRRRRRVKSEFAEGASEAPQETTTPDPVGE